MNPYLKSTLKEKLITDELESPYTGWFPAPVRMLLFHMPQHPPSILPGWHRIYVQFWLLWLTWLEIAAKVDPSNNQNTFR